MLTPQQTDAFLTALFERNLDRVDYTHFSTIAQELKISMLALAEALRSGPLREQITALQDLQALQIRTTAAAEIPSAIASLGHSVQHIRRDLGHTAGYGTHAHQYADRRCRLSNSLNALSRQLERLAHFTPTYVGQPAPKSLPANTENASNRGRKSITSSCSPSSSSSSPLDDHYSLRMQTSAERAKECLPVVHSPSGTDSTPEPTPEPQASSTTQHLPAEQAIAAHESCQDSASPAGSPQPLECAAFNGSTPQTHGPAEETHDETHEETHDETHEEMPRPPSDAPDIFGVFDLTQHAALIAQDALPSLVAQSCAAPHFLPTSDN